MLITKMERAKRSQATIDIVNEKAVHLFAFFGASKPAAEFDDQVLAEYADAALKERTPSTVERELRTLAQALKAARIVPPELPDVGNTYTPVEREITMAQTRELLLSVNPKLRDHVIMYRFTGFRKSELYRIERGDVDFDRGYIRVRGTKTREADRTIPMTAETRGILWRRIGQVPVFEKYKADDVMLRKAAIRAGLGPLSYNDLRRSFATDLILADAHPMKVAKLLGHKSTRMLERHYARLGKSEYLQGTIALLEPLRTDVENGERGDK